ncbi:MAG: lipid A biosynthesis acyltransferase [Gammaproteobacteria bacterium]
MAEAWIQQRERSNPLALRLICRFAQLMPRMVTRLWLWPITLYFFLFAPKTRVVSKAYLQRMPGKSGNWREVFTHLHCFASVVLDRVYFLTDRFDKFDVSIEGAELLQAALAENRGAILLGAHVGSFEAMRCLAIRHAQLPLKIMMYHDHNAMITRVLDELNPKVARSVINLAEPNALLQAKEAIEQGGFIGMLGDRLLPNEKSVSVSLLGGEVAFPIGPATLSAMLGVPVFVFFGIYTGSNRYRVTIQLLSEGRQLARRDRDAFVSETTQEYARKIEAVLLQYPYNWFNFYDFWSDKR